MLRFYPYRSNYFVATMISQTLIIVLDIILYTAMHLTINRFIHAKERRDGIEWDRTM